MEKNHPRGLNTSIYLWVCKICNILYLMLEAGAVTMFPSMCLLVSRFAFGWRVNHHLIYKTVTKRTYTQSFGSGISKLIGYLEKKEKSTLEIPFAQL